MNSSTSSQCQHVENNNNNNKDDDNGNLKTQNYMNDEFLRSFVLRRGEFVDRGFQATKTSGQPGGRRATCPEIWALAVSSATAAVVRPPRHVVLRVYGSRNSGKKTLAHQIYHHATTTSPESVEEGSNPPLEPPEYLPMPFSESQHSRSNENKSCETDDGSSRKLRFLLNGEQVELEILLESALESCPFAPSLLVYIIVYNVDNRDSFTRATQLIDRIVRSKASTSPSPVILVGNKIDLKRNQLVTAEEAKALAKVYKCSCAQVSALMSMNIEEMWSQVLRQLEDPCAPTHPQTWVERVLSRGRKVARSCEELFQRIIT